MKNLQVYCGNNIDLDTEIVGYCVDADNRILFVVTRDLVVLKIRPNSNKSDVDEVGHDFNFQTFGFAKLDQDDIKLIEFIVESGSILIALKSGILIRIGVTSFSPSSTLIYKHNQKISSIGLSPDQDLIALADEENGIYILSMDGEVVQASNALTEDKSFHQPVGVGWGSKETQFFGLDGRPSKEKQLKDKVVLSDDMLDNINRIESNVKFSRLATSQKKSTMIDWRGDGHFIGTLTYLENSNKHYLKVWNRNLDLQYMSEQLVDVERGILAWIPNGQFICCAQRRDQVINDISLFEKNGMIHDRITLPNILPNCYIKDISWSADSKILSLLANQFVITDDEVSYKPLLMLYTMQNFHYYLKFATYLSPDYDYFLKWDPIQQNRLHTISSSGHYREYNCCFEVTHSDHLSTVIVVDANKLLITPMEICNVPPPMSAIVLETKSLIYKVVINPLIANNIFIITIDNKLIYTCSELVAGFQEESLKMNLLNQKTSRLYDALKNYRVVDLEDAQSYQNLTVINEYRLVATRMNQTDCEIVSIKLPESQKETRTTLEVLYKVENRQILNISRDHLHDINSLALFLSDGFFMLINIETGTIQSSFEISTTTTNQILNYNFIKSQAIKFSNLSALVSLGQDSTLRLDADVIVSNTCSSFRITPSYLIFTTNDNVIHFILLKHLLDKKVHINEGSWTQSIENGGSLVVASEFDAKVVLQMPRGNLEILHPRILVFSLLTNLLDNRNYIQAIQLARRHRLNMNFLSDYLLRLFNEPQEINKFCNEIAAHDPPLLSIFITELEDNDTISGRYENIMKHLPSRRVDLTRKCLSDKVNLICSLIELPDDIKFIQQKILCLLKTKPRNIEKALHLVLALDKDAQNDTLKFILYFVDIDQLFHEALCTYDTNIILMVAAASNKDPKEYLALLDKFDKSENEILRKFNIDMHIKRYEKALEHLFNLLSTTNEKSHIRKQIMDLVETKRLYKHSVGILNSIDDDVLKETIWAKFAQYLFEKRCYVEAGLAYSKGLDKFSISNEDHFKLSLKSFLMVDDWEKCLAVLSKFSHMSQELKEESLKKISKKLIECGKCAESLMVIQPNVDSFSLDIITDLIDRDSWYIADFAASQGSKSNVRSKICSSILELAHSQQTRWTNDLSLAVERFNRLKELIIMRQERAFNGFDSGNYFTSDTLSTIDGSEISSVASAIGKQSGRVRSSVSSIKTRTSSKSNKSQNVRNKRINLKIGSRHEDIAIILELKKFISKQRSNHEESTRIISASFEYCDLCEARGIKISFEKILTDSLEFAKQVSEQLWPPGAHFDQKYSLYKRFSGILSSSEETYENVDFEILLRPGIPNSLINFEI